MTAGRPGTPERDARGMIPCTLRQLEVFVAAAENRHFGRTAGALGISQPAVTKQIATLERQIGKTLFVRRRGSTPVLSRDGATFLGQARRLLAEVEILNAQFAATAGEPSLVRIASGPHLLSRCIRPWLPELARAHDSVMVACSSVESSAEGLRALENGEADLLVHWTGRLELPGFHIEVARPVRLVLCGGRSYAALRGATPEAISELPFVMAPQGSETERLVLHGLAGAGVICSRIVLRQQYADVAKQLVQEGLGVSVFLETMVEEETARGDLVRFDLELPTLHYVICRRDRPPTAPVELVAASLREALKK